MSRMKICFDKEWIEEKRRIHLTIRQIESYIRQIEYVQLVSGDSYEIIVDVDVMHQQRFIGDFQRYIEREFFEDNVGKYITFEQYDLKSSEEVHSTDRLGTASEGKSGYQNIDNNFEEIISSIPMRYSEELRKYLTEVYAIIPVLKEMNCLNIFWKRSLLLSMDEGFGITTFLSALLSVFIKRELISPVSAERGIRKYLVEKNEENLKDQYVPWNELVKELENINLQNHQRQEIYAIVFIDISQWIDDIHTYKLGSYINMIRDLSNNFICVFRMPFMEKDIIEDVYGCISDSMSLKCLAVPPVSMESMVEYVVTKLKSAGYKNADDCSEYIERSIITERRDNSFFGFKTLDKIITDILYEQALVNMEENKILDTIMLERMPGQVSVSENGSPWKTLDQLMGLHSVKIQLKEIVAQIQMYEKLSREGRIVERPSIHMMFTGNPGTGKTL